MKLWCNLQHDWPIARMALCSQGRYLFTTSGESDRSTIWDIQKLEKPTKLSEFGEGGSAFDRVMDAAFSPQGNSLVLVSPGRGIEFRHPQSGELLEVWEKCEPKDYNRGYSHIAFDQAGAYLFVNGWRERQISVLNTHTGNYELNFPSSGIGPFALHPSGSLMACTLVEEGGASVRFVSLVDSPSLLDEEHDIFADIGSIQFSPDGESFVVAGGFPPIEIDVFQFPDVKEIGEWFGLEAATVTRPWCHEWGASLVSGFAYTPNSSSLLLPGPEGEIFEWSIEDKALTRTWQAHDELLTAVVLHHQRNLLLSASRDGSIKLWRWSP